jgi:transposase
MYVGLDVHKDSCQAAFVNARGKIVKEDVFNTDKHGLEKLVKSTKRHHVVMEASSSSLHLYDLLRETCDVKVAHPTMVKAIASARIKTDKIDARILAHLLRADLIPESYVPSKEQRQVRLLIRHRASLVRIRTSLKNQVHALLTREGIKVPFDDAFKKRGMVFLRNLELEEIQRISLDSMLSVFDLVNAQIEEFDFRIEHNALNDKYAKLLVTIKGVGCLTALAVSSEICDIRRFTSHKKFCSFTGLVPSIHQSGNIERKGRITKQGNKLLRWLLIQCARSAVRHSRRFRKKYKRLLARGVDENKAIVAIARNLAVVMYFMLVRNEPYKEESKGGSSFINLVS